MRARSVYPKTRGQPPSENGAKREYNMLAPPGPQVQLGGKTYDAMERRDGQNFGVGGLRAGQQRDGSGDFLPVLPRLRLRFSVRAGPPAPSQSQAGPFQGSDRLLETWNLPSSGLLCLLRGHPEVGLG